MPLESGTKLGPYLIVEPIGAGGMGEVYKATDTRLDRTVAIKVLPTRFSEDAERKQRFEREARVIAALNHPHICTLHDVGRQDDVDFLVMEYLEGQSLAERLGEGPMPVDEALKVAVEVADALDKAHGEGVTHRDLKPGNIMLTADGAKLLDFGLSKLSQPAAESSEKTDSTLASTLPGTVLGTVPYMAPEQLEGNDAGPRTDIFAFGAVLYEMLTGKRAFDGKSQALLIAAIVSTDPPPVSESVPDVSSGLEYIVTRCLRKEPEERIQTAWDLLSQLKWVAEGGEHGGVDPNALPLTRQEKVMRAGLVAAILLVLVVTPVVLSSLFGSGSADPTRFLVNVPDMPVPESIAMSPDGQLMAYAARDAGSMALFLRPTDSLAPQRVAGTEGAERPFWDPDSQWVAFFADGQLKRVNIDGSAPPQPIAEASDFQGGTWNRDGVILFASTAGLQRVLAAGGEPVSVPVEGDARTEPWFLPDGSHYLFLSGSADGAAIHAGDLGSTDSVEIVDAHSNPVYVDPGYLLYHREGTLFAVGFDAGGLAIEGESQRIAEGLPFSESGAAAFSASANGVLLYRSTPAQPDSPAGIAAGDLVSEPPVGWLDRETGGFTNLAENAGWYGVDLAPDGERVAIHRHDPGGGDIWIFEPGLERPVQFTFDVGRDNSSPVWSPDGTEIVYASRQDGEWGLYVKASDNTGEEVQLLTSDVPIVPMSWVGDVLVYTTTRPGTASGIEYITLTEDGASEPEVYLDSPADERHPQLSPDGEWIAFSSNHELRSEVYVEAFPEGTGRNRISLDGGVFPRWRGDTGELYFMSLVSAGAMMAVDLSVQGAAIRRDGDPEVLFQTGFLDSTHPGGYAHAYSVSADGERFVMPQFNPNSFNFARGLALATAAVNSVSADRRASLAPGVNSGAPIHVVLHWTALLPE